MNSVVFSCINHEFLDQPSWAGGVLIAQHTDQVIALGASSASIAALKASIPWHLYRERSRARLR